MQCISIYMCVRMRVCVCMCVCGTPFTDATHFTRHTNSLILPRNADLYIRQKFHNFFTGTVPSYCGARCVTGKELDFKSCVNALGKDRGMHLRFDQVNKSRRRKNR